MNRLVAAIALFALAAGAAAPARAATLQDFLNAPVWYLQYEVTVTSTHTETVALEGADLTINSNLTRVMSDTQELNLRSQGPGTIGMQAIMGGKTGSMSAADAQKMSNDMMAMMETTANWMVSGTSSEPASPSRIDYRKVETRKGVVGETGEIYDTETITTIKGEGKVLVVGLGVILFEMNTAKKDYALLVPFGASPTGPGVTRESITVHKPHGGQSQETRESSEQTLDFPPMLALDVPQPAGMQGGVLIRGTLDAAAGKIAGEQTFQAHYTELAKDIPATVVVKYTLTMTPPKQ